VTAVVVTTLLLVRHGQSTWNADGRWQGQADPPLSDLGEEQARAAAPAVADVQHVWSSDLARAARTAELLGPAGAEVQLDPRLRERHAGEWTGLTRAEIDERYPGYIDEHRSPPGFEDDDQLLARVEVMLHDIVRAVPPGAFVLVVTHGGVIRTVERAHGAPPEPVPNLGGRVLEARDGVFALGDRRLLIDPDDVAITVPRQI
jgi:broad specificity phosphatase PhoE